MRLNEFVLGSFMLSPEAGQDWPATSLAQLCTRPCSGQSGLCLLCYVPRTHIQPCTRLQSILVAWDQVDDDANRTRAAQPSSSVAIDRGMQASNDPSDM